MKHVYPLRHPTSMDSAPQGQTSASRDRAREPSLPHEHDESSHSQSSGTPQQKEVGKTAYGNATDGTTDTDRGAQMDQVYNEKLAPDRGADKPRQ
jgi:hypothetical protein